MAGPMRTRAMIAVLAAGVLVLAPASAARAESALWTLTASPLTATTGVETSFALTGTNEDPLAALLSSAEIGCILLDVPTNFSVKGATVTGSSAGDSWHVDPIVGNRVKVHADSGGDRLALLDWVRFTVTATALSTGSLTWNASAYRQQDCSGTGALVGVSPVVVVTGATPTPTPTPTPVAAPSASPSPTPTPTRLLPLPTILPSLEILPTPTPTTTSRSTPTPSSEDGQPAASSSPGATPPGPSVGSEPPGPSSTGAALPSDGGAATPASTTIGGGATAGQEAIGPPRVRFDTERLDVGFGTIGLLQGLDVWVVPAATIAGPGLLLLLLVALQAAGALAWIPAVRRLRGQEVPTG